MVWPLVTGGVLRIRPSYEIDCVASRQSTNEGGYKMPLQAGSGNKDEEVSPRPVLDLITGKWRSQAVCAAAELGIADILKDGPRSTLEIATAIGASEDAVYRLLRALASLGLFLSLSERRFIDPSGPVSP